MRRIGVIGTALALVSLGLVGAAPGAAADEDAAMIQLVLDASGSMAEKDASGRPKIESARKALTTTVDALDPAAKVGMRVYGATVKDGDNTDPNSTACKDTQQVVPLGAGNRDQLKQAIRAFAPLGHTPTIQALKAAVGDLGTSGKRHIVLVSDGEANCTPDPCRDVRALQASGVDIQVDTVGMSLNENARKQLKCIADATGGSYYDTTGTADLTTSLKRITTKALRGYDFQGKPVTGGKEYGKGPKLAPGQYLDRLTGQQRAYYTVDVPEGHSVAVNATAKPDNIGDTLGYLEVRLLGSPSTQCARSRSQARADFTGDADPLHSATAHRDPVGSGRSAPYGACKDPDKLVVELAMNFPKAPDVTPVELVVTTTPWPKEPVRGTWLSAAFAGLPPAVNRRSHEALVPQLGKPTMTVVGGTSFNGAAELKPGISRDELLIGETVVYKVRLDWGQEAALRVTSDGDSPALVNLLAYGPQRGPLYTPWSMDEPLDHITSLGGDHNRERSAGAYVPPVRANNVFSSNQHTHQVANPGEVYFVLSAARHGAGQDVQGKPLPVALSLQVKGTAGEGAPNPKADPRVTPSPWSSAAATPSESASGTTASPGATQSPSTGGTGTGSSQSRLPVLLGGGAAALALMGAGLVWMRRRP